MMGTKNALIQISLMRTTSPRFRIERVLALRCLAGDEDEARHCDAKYGGKPSVWLVSVWP